MPPNHWTVLVPSSDSLMSATTPRSIIDHIVPPRGSTVPGEIKCYSIPYGVMGTVSHLLTFYTIACLRYNRRPWWPFTAIRYEGRSYHPFMWSLLDISFAIISLLLSTAIAIFTVVNCKNTLPLLFIGIWKTSISILNGGTAAYVTYALFRSDYNPDEPIWDRFFGTHVLIPLLCLPGMGIGLAGVIMLVIDSWDTSRSIRILTFAFSSALGLELILLPILLTVYGYCTADRDSKWELGQLSGFFLPTAGNIIIFATVVFYADWVLALVTGNLLGTPSGDVAALYWNSLLITRTSQENPFANMLLSSIFPIAAFTAYFGAAYAQAQLAEGRYRILNGVQSARSFPSGGQQGPFQVDISMSDQFASIYEQWDVVSDGNGGYIIQSAATGAKAFAPQTLNTQVLAASNEQTSWFILNASNSGQDNLYIIKIPFQDLLWTNTPRPSKDNAIFLKGSDGSAIQRFVFSPV
ncbi:hypothetical protein P691DRAFT_777637 [Macrolepiota fuliginosa MF-IS2]|uniref:Uncharacterized protein n=1 Tax=Macrolepiota fuliginosa MF-IS2 TaxID=1400762 RepID=A0A9P5X8M4_9AGAR|nr:hypothetical protein P691DRAFT_777637 [Macrolepiota fuliginosa MF-IS2]